MKIKRERSLEKFIRVSQRMTGPRVLVADIETFPIVAYVWGLFKQNISLEQIAEDWSLMSFAAKWLGQPEVYYLDNRDRVDAKDDSVQLAALYRILSETDMVIAHNGARFDMPKIRARLALNNYPPIAPVKVIDTLLLNRTAFGFTSQKLQYVSSKFAEDAKSDHKKFPGWKLWLGCMAHDKSAWRECEAYNITDVTALEETYINTRGWHIGGPNFGPYIDHKDDEHNCPNCGSSNVIARGTRKTQVGIYTRYNCTDCGSWSRGRVLIASRKERAHILMN